MSDPQVAPIYLDHSAEHAVARETADFFREAMDHASRPVDEKSGRPAYLSVNPDFLREWLIASLGKPDAQGKPLAAARTTTAITAKVLQMTVAVSRLDSAIAEVVANTSATPAVKNLYADHPDVMDALRGQIVVEGEAVLVALPGHWEYDASDKDPRKDCLMGVLRWQGVHLCRPVLCDLVGFQKHFEPKPPAGPILPVPNVDYVQRMGNH